MDQKADKSTDAPTSQLAAPVTQLDLEAELIRQEHRLYRVVLNRFYSYRDVDESDPRRKAAREAFWHRIIFGLIPGGGASGVLFAGIITIAVAVWANMLLSEQNATLNAQTELLHAQTALLNNQNQLLEREAKLLEAQNIHVRQQNELADASRRSNIMGEMTAIFDRVNAYVVDQERDGEKPPPRGWVLPEVLYGRIIAACDSCMSYRTVRHLRRPEGGVTADYESKLHSPERTHMLLFLMNMPVDRRPVFKRASFESVYLLGTNLEGRDLSEILLLHADLRYAQLAKASLRNADLSSIDTLHANLSGADMRGAILWRASLHTSNLQNADLRGADLREAILDGSIVAGVNFEGAIVDHLQWIENTLSRDRPPIGFDRSKWQVGRTQDGLAILVPRRPSKRE